MIRQTQTNKNKTINNIKNKEIDLNTILILRDNLLKRIKEKGLKYSYYSLNDGNKKYTLLLDKNKNLCLYMLIGCYYSKLLLKIPFYELNKDFREVIK